MDEIMKNEAIRLLRDGAEEIFTLEESRWERACTMHTWDEWWGGSYQKSLHDSMLEHADVLEGNNGQV